MDAPSKPADGGDVTELLARWAGGDRAALDAVMTAVYGELRRIADAYLHRERSGHTLQPTALVHEAWIRLSRQADRHFEHRKQFFGLAAQVMRRILVDHARAAKADKRGGGAVATTLGAAEGGAERLVDVLALDQALDQLAAVNARQARVIELRYLAGLNLEEMAEVLGVSPATVSRDQKVAEAWLGHALRSG
jgi:RNA polymerase sigma factor (TIGR02999 family)